MHKPPPPLIPKPCKYDHQPGQWMIPPRLSVGCCAEGNPTNDGAAERGRAWVDHVAHATNRECAPSVETGCTDVRLRLVQGAGDLQSEVCGPESYTLIIEPCGVSIEAHGQAGLFYGVQTLGQLLATAEQDALRCCRIADWPRYRWRGFMLDSARHMQPVSWIKRHIDRMAALKLNRFHWHLTDDQGWRAEIRQYPKLTDLAAWRGEGEHCEGGFYTQDQMRDVACYAAARHITVIPEVEMPGHCNAALVAHPELSCGGAPLPVADRGWDAFTAKAGRRAFCAGNESVYEFLQHVLSELADVFNPPVLHLGGDETPTDTWDACEECNAARNRLGLNSAQDLRAHLLNRIATFCHDQLGRATTTWTQGVRRDLPKAQTIHAWHPHEAAAAARLGHDVINSCHEWTYLDYPERDCERQHKPDWMIVLNTAKAYHFDPMPDGLEPEHRHRILGSEAAMWTEYAPDAQTLEKQIMPRLAAFSEALWSPAWGRSYDEFLRRLQWCAKLGLTLRVSQSRYQRNDLTPSMQIDEAVPTGQSSS